jgi:hypothetical protein
MQNVIFTEKTKQSAGGYALLQQASRTLEEILGQSGSLVTAEWDRGEDDRGRTLYILRISDWTGSATAVFAPADLEHAGHLRSRLYRLWGDLLQVRSHYQLQELADSSGPKEG